MRIYILIRLWYKMRKMFQTICDKVRPNTSNPLSARWPPSSRPIGSVQPKKPEVADHHRSFAETPQPHIEAVSSCACMFVQIMTMTHLKGWWVREYNITESLQIQKPSKKVSGNLPSSFPCTLQTFRWPPLCCMEDINMEDINASEGLVRGAPRWCRNRCSFP